MLPADKGRVGAFNDKIQMSAKFTSNRDELVAEVKDLDYGKGYQYAHHEPDAIADMPCLPSALEGRKYYEPKERGFEKEIKRRLDGWEEIKKKRRTPPPD